MMEALLSWVMIWLWNGGDFTESEPFKTIATGIVCPHMDAADLSMRIFHVRLSGVWDVK